MAGTPPMCLSGNEISVDVMHDGNEAIWDCHRLSLTLGVYQHIDMPLGFHALIQFPYQYPVLTSSSSDVGLFFLQKKSSSTYLILICRGLRQTRKANKAYCFKILLSKIVLIQHKTECCVLCWCFWLWDVCSLALHSILVTMSTV